MHKRDARPSCSRALVGAGGHKAGRFISYEIGVSNLLAIGVTTDDKRKVEPGEFAWIEKPYDTKTFHNFRYAKVSGCNSVLVDAETDFGITA